MINQTLQIAIFLAVIIYFCFLFWFLKKKSLNLKYTLLWIFSGLILLLLDFFPSILYFISNIIGISSPVNALFLVVLFCVIVILISLTAIVSKLNQKITNMAQYIALIEKRLREQEKRKN